MASSKTDSDFFSYNWENVKAYKFCLSMLVIVFAWALLLAVLELLEAFAKMAVGGGVKPYIVALGDLVSFFCDASPNCFILLTGCLQLAC